MVPFSEQRLVIEATLFLVVSFRGLIQIFQQAFANFFFVHTSSCNFTDDVWTKKKFSTFSYKLVQISPIMILVNSGAFLSISSWFSELTELIFVMIPYISSTGYPPTTQGIMGHVQVANSQLFYLGVPLGLWGPISSAISDQ